MWQIHTLVGIGEENDDWYAECACGLRTHGDSDGEALDAHRGHKQIEWLKDAS